MIINIYKNLLIDIMINKDNYFIAILNFIINKELIIDITFVPKSKNAIDIDHILIQLYIDLLSFSLQI